MGGTRPVADRTLRVELGERSYGIELIAELPGPRVADAVRAVRGAPPHRPPVLVVTDSNVGPLYADGVRAALEGAGFGAHVLELPAGEASKQLTVLSDVLDRALAASMSRRDVIVALGGGVIGDLAGFAGAVLHRGVPVVQVPTSLLAQVDSSVGGKTAVNHPAGKNLIGAFWQPRAVVSSHAVLATLPARERRCGLAEAVKHGFIADAALVGWCEAHAEELVAVQAPATLELVERCCRIKAAVVADDERESGRRAVLNLGHTLGHAYERLAGYGQRTHGEAVALGMVWAARLSERLGEAPAGLEDRVVRVLGSLGLPVEIDDSSLPGVGDLIDAARTDKKADGDRVRFVLLQAPGRTVIRDLEWASIQAALGRPRPQGR